MHSTTERPAAHLLLSPAHYEGLHTVRGIAPALIRQRGYYTATQPADLIDLTFSQEQAKLVPALVIPRWDVHGQPHGVQIRPDNPRQFSNGRLGKYEGPKGSRLILDVHPAVQPQIGDPTSTLWITEGIPKGDALASHGACAIALNGVSGYRGTNEYGGKVILPDWEHVALNGREVIVVYDSDLYQKPAVELALKALYNFLRSKSAIPRLVQWPEAYREKKWGVDDFLAEGKSLDDLRAMLPPQGPLPSARPRQAEAGLKLDLLLTKTGMVRPIVDNILTILRNDPRWQGVLGYDAFANQRMFCHPPPWLSLHATWEPRPLVDTDDTLTTAWLQREYALFASIATVRQAVDATALEQTYHPVRDYLHGLQWDGTARLDTFFVTYCGAKDTPYIRAVGAKTLIAAVARVEEPGCKVDTMTTLYGKQGILKSTLWRVVCSGPWFSDTLINVHDKDAMQNLPGVWFLEMGELSALHRSDREDIKRFMSSQCDRYRVSYGHRPQAFPRQTVFVGTTNRDDILHDDTGNRRFWIVPVEGAIDIAAVQRDRDQLWAEAYARYRQGETWYLDQDQEHAAEEIREAFHEEDAWTETVLTAVHRLDKVTIGHILEYGFGWDNKNLWTQAAQRRVGSILRNHGWEKKPYRAGKQLINGFQRVTPLDAVTPPTDTWGNSVSANKNNDVTPVTPCYPSGEKDLNNEPELIVDETDENDKNTSESLYSSIEMWGNRGNMGNTPVKSSRNPVTPHFPPGVTADDGVTASPLQETAPASPPTRPLLDPAFCEHEHPNDGGWCEDCGLPLVVRVCHCGYPYVDTGLFFKCPAGHIRSKTP